MYVSGEQLLLGLMQQRVGCSISKSELARRSDLSVQYISQLENGHKPLNSLDTAIALAGGLGLRLELRLVREACPEHN